MFKKSDLVGMKFEDAVTLAENNGYGLNIVAIDGEKYGTPSVKPGDNMIQVEIDKGLIKKA